MAAEVILVDDPTAHVRRVTLNRPEKRNALNHALRGAIVDALREADQDPDVRVMIVRGAGKCFSSGYELGRRQRGAGVSLVHTGRRRPLAAARDSRLDEHLGAGQAGDSAGARLLSRGRQRARHLL